MAAQTEFCLSSHQRDQLRSKDGINRLPPLARLLKKDDIYVNLSGPRRFPVGYIEGLCDQLVESGVDATQLHTIFLLDVCLLIALISNHHVTDYDLRAAQVETDPVYGYTLQIPGIKFQVQEAWRKICLRVPAKQDQLRAYAVGTCRDVALCDNRGDPLEPVRPRQHSR